MDTLPAELQVKILSFLHLNDLAKLRRVSKSFKCSVGHSLRLITHISLPSFYNYVDVCSYTYQEYLCKPSVLADEKTMHHSNTVVNLFCSFLGKYCPMLQVIDLGKDLDVTFTNLMQLPSTLRFIRCRDIKNIPSDKVQLQVDQVLNHLQALECFDLSSYASNDQRAELSFKLAQKRQKQDKPVALFNPKVKLVDRKTCECFYAQSLVYDIIKGGIDRYHPIYPSIAANLVGLSANFLPSDEFCQASLPMLQYLSIVTKSLPPTYNNVLFTSPHLKCFGFTGLMDVKLLETIFAHLHSLKYLKVIDICPRIEGENRAKVVFPSQIREFRSRSSYAFDLQRCVSNSVVKFEVGSLINWYFEFPNLRQLTLLEAEFHSFPHDLSQSLLVSTKLRFVDLFVIFDEVSAISSIQSMVDACSKCKMLTTLRLRVCYANTSDESESDEEEYVPSGEVVVKQDDFLLVKHLEISMPCHLVFHANDRFSSLQVFSSLHLTDENSGLTFHFKCSGTQRICIKQEMKQLTRVEIDVERHPWIVEQSQFFTHVQQLSLSLHSHVNDSVLTDDESLAKIFSLRKLNWLELNGRVKSTILCRIFHILRSHELLTEVSLNLEFSKEEKNKKKTVAVSLPLKLERMSIKSHIPIDFSSELQTSIKYLKVQASVESNFNFPNLEEAYFVTFNSTPTINLLNSLRNSTKLKQLTLFILYGSRFPSAEYVQELLTVASQMKCLSKLNIGPFFGDVPKKADGCVNVIQSDFPSVESFRLRLPMQIVFHPLNVFKNIIVRDSLFFKSSRLCYDLASYNSEMLTVLNMSGLDNITQLNVSIGSYGDSVAKIAAVEQLPNVQSVKFDGSFANEFIKFFASLPKLRKLTVTASIHQEDVLDFFLAARSKGPLDLELKETFGKVTPMTDSLHEFLNNLKDRGVVSSFVSPWLCGCAGDCWLKKQGTQ